MSSEEPNTPETLPAAPPEPPAPSANASAADGAVVMKRLNGLTAAIKAGLSGPEGARVKDLFGKLNAPLKNKDYDRVAKLLDELEGLLRG